MPVFSFGHWLGKRLQASLAPLTSEQTNKPSLPVATQQSVMDLLSKPQIADDGQGGPRQIADLKGQEATNKFAYSPRPDESGVRRSDAPVQGQPKRKALLTEGRTEFNKVYLNEDGSKTLEHSLQPSSYRDGDNWKDVDVSLEDNAAKDRLQTKSNSWRASFDKDNITQGVGLTKDGQSVNFRPIGGSTAAASISGAGADQKITYTDVWPGVDIEYRVTSAELKESIIIKRPDALRAQFEFMVQGANLSSDPDLPGYLRLDGTFSGFTIAPPTIMNKTQGLIGADPYVRHNINGSTLTINLDAAWARQQPASAYPLVIDPTVVSKSIGSNYANYRSDGLSCGVGQGCGNATGNLGPGVGQSSLYYRFIMRASYDELYGKALLGAYLELDTPSPEDINGYTTYDNRYIVADHAVCWGYNCFDNGITDGVALVSDYMYMDVTHIYQELMNRGDYGGWLIVRGEEIPNYYSFKQFNAAATKVVFHYDSPTPMTTPAAAAPVNGAVLSTTQPSLLCEVVTDPDVNDRSYYQFRVATSPDGETGTVVNSGWQSAPQWTVPEGVLQDGVTYYWRAYTWDGVSQMAATAPNWTRSFRVDMRTGKDATQSFDTSGPVSANLATGNVTTSGSTHSIAALGGSIGLGLEYNSPLRTQSGLKGEYWNVASGWGNDVPTGPPKLTRTDSRIDFPWGTSSPAPGYITDDWFFARWTGYFVAPNTGTYYFGANNDDDLRIYIDNQQVYNNACFVGICYGSSVSLQAGQIVPFRVEYIERAGGAFAKVAVKGAVGEQFIPDTMLRTEPGPATNRQGLVGRYYYDSGNHTFPANENEAFMVRTEPHVAFNWGGYAPGPGTPNDNFLVRWNGYLTAPAAGTYYFYSSSDDGSRVVINGQTVHDRWTPGSFPATQPVTLGAGQTVPITVDYYEALGNANLELRVTGSVVDQVVPASWLMPQVSGLPAGWQAGADVDGNLSYDRATVSGNSVTL
ncbi:MAG TPA: PA14 domain-containing protein, partial [Candidatus Saccharimonadales bacterium]